MQAAIGVAQLGKLDGFIAARRHNWARLRAGLSDLEDRLILPEPTPHSEPSWFGFALTLRPGFPIERTDVIAAIEGRRVSTRLLFGGNLLRQPAYLGLPHRAIGELPNAEIITERTFWVGVYPGLDDEKVDYMIEVIRESVGADTRAPSTGRSAERKNQ